MAASPFKAVATFSNVWGCSKKLVFAVLCFSGFFPSTICFIMVLINDRSVKGTFHMLQSTAIIPCCQCEAMVVRDAELGGDVGTEEETYVSTVQ